MITFLNLGNKGNLGNQLFQIASTIGIANSNEQPYCFPVWNYNKYFQNKLPSCSIEKYRFLLWKEKHFEYQNINLRTGDYNLNGWFQSEKYFDNNATKNCFTFKSSIYNDIRAKYSFLLNSKHILISVRRGDFVNHPFYFQLSYKFYFLAITENFADWKSRKLIFTSDDIDYCKKHFSFLENSYFLEELNAIEQLAFGSLAKDFVISNSTFSWWIAWLGEKKDSVIIRPGKNFRGDFAERNNDKDFFPGRWVIFDDSNKQIDTSYLRLIIIGETNRLTELVISLVKRGKKKLKSALKRIIYPLN